MWRWGPTLRGWSWSTRLLKDDEHVCKAPRGFTHLNSDCALAVAIAAAPIFSRDLRAVVGFLTG